MIKNLNHKKKLPNRIVILGAGGFISSSVERRLKKLKINFKALTRKRIDFTKKNSIKKLSAILLKTDTVIFIAAKAPVKDVDMLIQNLIICKNIYECLKKNIINHLIYISSDAVYADNDNKLNEKSITQPSSLHGLMHLSREIMIKNLENIPTCFLRPTLIYGLNDPHDGYGPNKFIRLSKLNKDIKLFGKGEELRDHVWVEDVSQIICNICLFKSVGILNIASGKIISFKNIAEKIILIFNSSSTIKYIPRSGSMPHNGYRPFNNRLIKKTFPNFSFMDFSKAIVKIKSKE